MPPRSKDPGYDAWERLRVSADTPDAHFPPQEARNVVILNGGPSNNVVDADLDCAQARRLAPRFLPATGWVFGRASAPGSHRVYKSDEPLGKAQVAFED